MTQATPPLPSSSYWSMEHAQQLLQECAHVSYGITNDAIYRQILAQKDAGDPNAAYVYAILLLDYAIGTHSNTYNPNAEAEGYHLMWTLAQADHPYACEYIGAMGLTYLNQYIRLSKPELLQEQIRCLRVALRNGLKPYSSYANILLFQLNKDNSGRLLLTESTELTNEALVRDAVHYYSLCALEEGRSYCLGRMVEAYYHGIGVQKDLSAAAAWARVVADRFSRVNVYASVVFARKINEELAVDRSIYYAQETEAMYQQLRQQIPQSEF